MIEAKDPLAQINQAFQDLGISAVAHDCEQKNPLKRYYVELQGKTKIATLQKSAGELALRLKCISEPLVRPDPKHGRVCVEAMFDEHPTVDFKSLAIKAGFKDKSILKEYSLPLLLGAVNVDEPFVIDLAELPHLLLGGATGAGKSVSIHSMLNSLLLVAEEQDIKFALIDPKRIEFSSYQRLPVLRHPVYHTVQEAIQVLESLIEQMETRLMAFNRAGGCRNIAEYRAKGFRCPYIVLVIDELYDLIQQQGKGKPFEKALCRLAQKSRATGIHIIEATQHPSREAVTGLIKANFPARVAFKVASHNHSKVILDMTGAELLLGKGDGLFTTGSADCVRFKGAYITGSIFKPKSPAKIISSKKKKIFGKVNGLLHRNS